MSEKDFFTSCFNYGVINMSFPSASLLGYATVYGSADNDGNALVRGRQVIFP